MSLYRDGVWEDVTRFGRRVFKQAQRSKAAAMPVRLIAVTAPDGALLALCTSQVDAHRVCKPVAGARMWRCFPNCGPADVALVTPSPLAACPARTARSAGCRNSGDGDRKTSAPCPS